MTIEELQKRLNRWRKTKKTHKDRIPVEYWNAAVDLAKKSTASSVAGKLNLNITDLKRKMGLPAVPKNKLAFKELPVMDLCRNPIFEVTTDSGVTLKVYQ